MKTRVNKRRLLAATAILALAPMAIAQLQTEEDQSPPPPATADAEQASPSQDVRDKTTCTRQLGTVFQAIQAYRRDHKDIPNWLSDLVPKYLADTNALVCPITRRTGKMHSFEHLFDPKIKEAYLYEFCPLPMGYVWGGEQISMRAFKRRQMGLVGGEVPIVRCHLHSPVLNLAFSGRVYESGLNWEQNFTDLVDFSAWNPDRLFAETSRPAPVPARKPPPEPEEEPGAALLGKPAPAVNLPLLDGGEFDLAAHRDKDIVLLDFWASWCGPCRKAMPTLVEIAKEYADKHVRYVAVNLREQPAVIRKYLEREKLDIRVPLDKEGQVAKQYGVRGIPTMVVVDRQGLVRKVHVGSSPDLKQVLTRALDDLLAGKTPAN